MAKRRRDDNWFERQSGTIIATAGLIIVAVIQIADAPEPLACSDVRSTVLAHAEENPETLTLLYPDDSREQRECEINDFMRQLNED